MISAALREALTWYYFIPRVSEAGSRWFEDFCASGGMDICGTLEDAVDLARLQRVVESRQALAAATHWLRRKRHALPSTLWLVVRRLYLAVYANVCYVDKQYSAASRLLEQAATTEENAIVQADFLATLARSRCEFCLHHARIARNQYRWCDMFEWLQVGRAMVRNERALCRLADGRRLFMQDVDVVFRAIEPLSLTETEALYRLTDAPGREAEFERAARCIATIGTVVVPFD